MAVEATMGQVGRFHDVGNTDAAKAVFAKQRAGGLDDPLAVLGGLFAAYSHCTSAMRRAASLDNLYDDRHQ